MLNVLRRSTCRLVRLGVRLQSTTAPVVKPLHQILAEMAARKPQGDVKRSATGPLLHAKMANDDLFSPIQLGDIVLVGLNPFVVVGVPSALGEPLVVADAGGSVREVPIPAIEARLGRFCQMKKLGDAPIFADPVLKRSLSHEMYARVSGPLRRFYTQASKMSSRILPRVRQLLWDYQKYDRASTLPYIDFVAKVCNHELGSEIPIRDFYAVRLAMEHYKCSSKYLLEFHYFSRYTLTVLPLRTEQRNLSIMMASEPLTDGKEVQNFFKDYAVGNMRGMGNTEVEGCAIELLRRLPYFQNLNIEESIAAERAIENWGDNPPGLQAYAYEWFTKDTLPNFEIGTDRLSGIRADFEDPVYCIDDADAKEIDDGISFRELSSEVAQIGIHVADPTSFFEAGEVLPTLRGRPTSVYLNDTVSRMWPEQVSQKCGLIEGGNPPAISVLCDINMHTGEVRRTRIAAHRLKNVKQMTPEQITPLLDDAHGIFRKLAQLANILAKSRLVDGGAFTLRMNEEPTLDTLSSKRLVAEMMIMANRTIGSYCLKNRIPTIYRSQMLQFWSPEQREEFYDDIKKNNGVAGFRWREALQRSIPTVRVMPHAGLGIPLYTRFTSPLRRLEDTLVHFQLVAHLAKQKLPFKMRDINAELPWITCAQVTAREGERVSRRFATLRHMELNINKKDPIFGIFAVPGDDAVAAQVYLPKFDLMASFSGEQQSVVVDSQSYFQIVGISSIGDRIDVKLCT